VPEENASLSNVPGMVDCSSRNQNIVAKLEQLFICANHFQLMLTLMRLTASALRMTSGLVAPEDPLIPTSLVDQNILNAR
jgi:hypothetical protein